MVFHQDAEQITVRREPLLGVFGEKLRQHREQRGLELEAISNTTKISPRMLRALEDEHFDQLPGGVFNKGFVRAYARQVGLDEEEAVADYLVALRENQFQQQSILPDFHAPLTSQASVPTAKNLPARSVDGFHSSQEDAQAGAGAAALSETDPPKIDIFKTNPAEMNSDGRSSGNARGDGNELLPKPARRRNEYPRYPSGDSFASQPNPSESSTQLPRRKLSAALLAIVLLLAFWNLRRHAHPPLTSTAAAVSNGTPVPAFVPPASPQAVSTNPANAVPPNDTTTNKEKPSKVTITPSAKPSPKPSSKTAPIRSVAAKPAPTPHPRPAKLIPAPKPPKTFTLLIRADKTAWVSITADGKPIADETLIAPAHTSVRAVQEIIVKTRNSSGISFALNGRDFPVSGGAGEAKTYVFNSFGYHLQ